MVVMPARSHYERQSNMTKAQEVKKALKGHFDKVTAVNGKGTAYGWVELHIWDKSLENLPYRDQNEQARKKVYELIKAAEIKLYTYCDDGGYGDHDCILISVN